METCRDSFFFLACDWCGVDAEEPCRTKGVSVPRRPITRIHAGRPRAPWAPPLIPGRRIDEELTDARLGVWQRRATLGDAVDDIAAELRMNRPALDQFVARARKRGHPKAVYHASAVRV